MIFLGYNFLRDRYCWQPTPTTLKNIKEVTIRNGIYDHFNVTKDVTFDYATTLPGQWNLQTQMDADFAGNITAGNIDYVLAQISNIKVKRRIKGTFDWITLFVVPISKISDIDFVKYDYIAQNNVEYEYAIVPVIGNTEGEYSINSIKSQFYGIFITDNQKSYKFLENAGYSNNERVHKSGIFEPYGSKYPIVVNNGILSYDKGTVKGDVMVLVNDNLDRDSTVTKLKALQTFLTDSNGKVLKDFNGNIWMVSTLNSVTPTYYNELGMGMASVSFDWVEVGNSNDGSDLYYNGLIDAIN